MIPGPGQYNSLSGFGKSKRYTKTETDSIPGPGNYEEKRNFGNGPKISMSFSRPKSAIDSNPGPGYYESNRHSTPSIK